MECAAVAIRDLNLPDLDGWLAEYRAARLAVQREELEAARSDTLDGR